MDPSDLPILIAVIAVIVGGGLIGIILLVRPPAQRAPEKLNDATTDDERAWDLVEKTLAHLPPETQTALWRAAVPHWFNAEVLDALIPGKLRITLLRPIFKLVVLFAPRLKTFVPQLYADLKDLSFVEISLGRGHQLEPHTRQVMLKRFRCEKPKDFRDASRSAAKYFFKAALPVPTRSLPSRLIHFVTAKFWKVYVPGIDHFDYQIEWLCHLLVVDRNKCADALWRLGHDWLAATRYTELEALADTLVEQVEACGVTGRAAAIAFLYKGCIARRANRILEAIKYSEKARAEAGDDYLLADDVLSETIALARFFSQDSEGWRHRASMGVSDRLWIIPDDLATLDRHTADWRRYEEALSTYTRKDRVGRANTLKVRVFCAREPRRREKDRVGRANTLKVMGDELLRLKRHAEALLYYQQACALYHAASDGLGEGNTLKAMGDVLQLSSKGDDALHRYKDALVCYHRVNSRLGEAGALKAIGNVLESVDRHDESSSCFNVALNCCYRAGDNLGAADILIAMGNALRTQGKRREALRRYQTALTLYRAAGDPRGEATMLRVIGGEQLTVNEYNEALKEFETALEVYRTLGDCAGEADMLKAIGDDRCRQGKFEQAAEQYRKAIFLYHSAGSLRGEPEALLALGGALTKLGWTDEAQQQYGEARDKYRAVADRSGEASVLQAIGDMLMSLRRNGEALSSFEEALALYRAAGNHLAKARLLKKIGDVLKGLNRRDEALTRYQEALNLFETLQDQSGADGVRQAMTDLKSPA